MSLFAVVGSDDTISLPFEASGEHIPVHFIVFDQQNFRLHSFPLGLTSSIVQRTESPPSIGLRDGCRHFPGTTLLFWRSITTGDGGCLGIRAWERASDPVLFNQNRKTVTVNRLNQIVGRAQFKTHGLIVHNGYHD